MAANQPPGRTRQSYPEAGALDMASRPCRSAARSTASGRWDAHRYGGCPTHDPARTQGAPRAAANLGAERRLRKQGPSHMSAERGSQHHSHSIVPGGLLVMSYVTRLIPRTSLMMRVATRPRNPMSKG